MNKKGLMKKLTVFIIMCSLLCLTFSPAASAFLDRNGSITLHIHDADSGTYIEGAVFRLYFFAQAFEKVDGVGYEYVIPYDDCKMDMGNLQDAYLPIHLTHYAQIHALPYEQKTSDKNGELIFNDLIPGVYLVVPTEIAPEYFVPSPFVINIPLFDESSKNWIHDVNATPKMLIYKLGEPERMTYLSVMKEWDTDGEAPDSVSISLLRDFTEVEKITLDESNGWKYRWDNLSTYHSWTVVENDIPDGYTVTYITTSNTVTVINKKTPDKTPEESTSPENEQTTVPENETSTEPDEPTTKPDELIHTGQLNWPVPVFSIAGLLLFSIGWAILNLSKKETT